MLGGFTIALFTRGTLTKTLFIRINNIHIIYILLTINQSKTRFKNKNIKDTVSLMTLKQLNCLVTAKCWFIYLRWDLWIRLQGTLDKQTVQLTNCDTFFIPSSPSDNPIPLRGVLCCLQFCALIRECLNA